MQSLKDVYVELNIYRINCEQCLKNVYIEL